MKYRTIPGSDLKLSILGTGCWTFGGGEYWGRQDQKDAKDVVRASVENGINYFDTAEMYNEGRSESALGSAIKGIPRDRLVIGSKISPSNAYRGTLEKHCEASLKRLQTDFIDIYMIHWPIHPHSVRHFTSDEAIIRHPPSSEEAFESLRKLQKEGKIRYIGISNFSEKKIKEDVPSDIKVMTNQLPYNLLCRAIEFDTLPYCREKGIGVIGYITLMQGLLARVYDTVEDIPEWRRRTRHFSSKATPLSRHGEEGFEAETMEAIKAIDKIARDNGLKMSELAIYWSLSSGITCSLIGARNAGQLEQNLKALEIDADDSVLLKLNEVTDELKIKLGNHFDYYENVKDDRTI